MNIEKLIGKDDLVVVTGSGGFIGGHLVADLVDRGYKWVRSVDIKPLDDWYQVVPGVDNIQADLKDKDACYRATREARFVFNLAADMGGMGFIETHKAECMLSVLINTNMLLAAKDYGVERFFFSSSACVYAADKQTSPDVTPLKEGDAYPAMPEDGYGWEKLFSERMCRHFREDFGLQYACSALPQRVRPTRHLRWRPGEGPGRDLPQGHHRLDDPRPRHRDLGRRRADPQLHVHRRLLVRHKGAHGERHQRTAQPGQRRTGDDQSARGHRRRGSPASSSSGAIN